MTTTNDVTPKIPDLHSGTGFGQLLVRSKLAIGSTAV